jgi:hypothetical protein
MNKNNTIPPMTISGLPSPDFFCCTNGADGGGGALAETCTRCPQFPQKGPFIALPQFEQKLAMCFLLSSVSCLLSPVFIIGSVTRKDFLAALLSALQIRKPSIVVVLTDAPRVRAMEGLKFTRTYCAFPNSPQARDALFTGRFPHAMTADAPRLQARLLDNPPPATDDTLVVVTAPYAGVRGSHSAAHVPMVMRWPGKLPYRETDILISHVDLISTISTMAGREIPDLVQGRNLADLVVEGKGARPESIFVEGDHWRMIVRGLDKLVIDARSGDVLHLYNLGQDPEEQNNLAGDPSVKLWRDELKAHMDDWRRRLGDGVDPSGLKKRG